MNLRRLFTLSTFALLLTASAISQNAPAQPAASLPSEMPATFTPVTSSFDYVKRDVMIPMRDGVKLHAVITIPKGAKDAPILLTRTPYNAKNLMQHSESSHLESILYGYDNATDVIVQGGYIRVTEDVRGKYGSEGDYVMNRPLRGPLNPTQVDHATDTYDTIEWLVKNLPESNGRVGMIGISYDGFTTLMGLFNPHPALKVAVPMNPMVDGWRGDDWFHNGAFRLGNEAYIYDQEATRESDVKWWHSHADEYDEWLEASSAGEMGRRHGLEQVGFWRKILEHPAYDSWWQLQAMDKLLAEHGLKVPTMLVHSLWDQEDIYGAPAVYRALKEKNPNDANLYLALGPWYHGGAIHDGSMLGDIRFNSDTALYFRENILRPFLDRYLKPGTQTADVAHVNAFETGTNRWLKLPTWPSGCAQDCAPRPTPIYLSANHQLSFTAPAAPPSAYDEYVSDPEKPVPYRKRPVGPMSGDDWRTWLTTDQRDVATRPDVLVFETDKLTRPVKIAGQPIANLIASTSGTDSDWVVKLIDVYPDEYPSDPKMGGYQLMISADIFRGRYRESLAEPKAITPDKPLLYKFALPTADHVFLPGHRIMVQVQSTWFPLYDRNPQTFVENIFWAKPGDYKKATQRVYHAPDNASFIELPMVTAQ